MLLGILVSTLLVLLAINGALAWYVVNSMRNSPPSPSELIARMVDLEQEFVSLADSQARFLKRVSKRDRDESKRLADADQYAGPPLRPKEQLRQHLAQLRTAGQSRSSQ